MKVKKRPFNDLPFTKLFQDYTDGTGTIRSFFETPPAIKSVADSFQSFRFHGDRNSTQELLKQYNREHLSQPTVASQIEAFGDSDTMAIITGQQTTLFGGPLFTVYKTITAINYARRLQKQTGRTVVPVFWLADEDHDVEEIDSVQLPESYDLQSVTYRHQDYSDAPPAGNIQLGEEIEHSINALCEALDPTDFNDDLVSRIKQAYKSSKTFPEAFGELMMSMFSHQGLLLAGSIDGEIKKNAVNLFQKSVFRASALTTKLDNTTYRLKEEGYHDQVQIHSSNLFYITEAGSRVKIQHVDDQWSIPGKKWSEQELLEEIENHPERFSPNVFLRPVLQDLLLPVAGYVGGPGEIAYYAQMKDFYSELGYRMPAIIPRFSATIFESAIERIIKKLPFDWPHYSERIEDLEKEFVNVTDSVDIEKIFGIWRSQIDELSRVKRDEIGEIDPSLKGSVGKAKATYFSELDNLKGKVYRSVKEQEKVQIDRIRRIKNNIFPNGNLQEREIAFIYLMNKYGPDIWDQFLELLEDEEPFTHKEIYL